MSRKRWVEMEVDTAVRLLGGLTYKRGWKLEATDLRHRFENGVRVRVRYPARDLGRDQAEAGYPRRIRARADFALCVGSCPDDETLYRQLLERCLLPVEEHEAREALRVRGTGWAPFHPHREDGMARWGCPERDLTFGVV